VIHSFGRVVRRHEKDALFQHPSAWWPERDAMHRSPYSRRAAPGSQLRVWVPGEEDPFSDVRGLTRRESVTSWNSEFSDSPSSPTPVASRDRRLSLPGPYPDPVSNRNTLLDLAPDSTDFTFHPSLNGWQGGGGARLSGTIEEKVGNRISHVNVP
jgi:hypothetical protein